VREGKRAEKAHAEARGRKEEGGPGRERQRRVAGQAACRRTAARSCPASASRPPTPTSNRQAAGGPSMQHALAVERMERVRSNSELASTTPRYASRVPPARKPPAHAKTPLRHQVRVVACSRRGRKAALAGRRSSQAGRPCPREGAQNAKNVRREREERMVGGGRQAEKRQRG